MTTQNPAPTATNPVSDRRVQPDSPLSGEVKRGGTSPVPYRRVRRCLRIEGDVAYLPLTRGFTAILDAADAGLVDGNWFASGTAPHVYAARKARAGEDSPYILRLHRLLLGVKDLVVDHINGDTLDNRRANLRLCSIAENVRNQGLPRLNTSGVRGVYRSGTRFKAQLNTMGRTYALGSFATLEEAAEARRAAEVRFWGQVQPRTR